MEKFTAIDHMVGKLPDEAKKRILEHFQMEYLEKSLRTHDQELSLEQGERLKRLVYAADEITDAARKKYGLAETPILSGSVKLITPDGSKDFFESESFQYGGYHVFEQEIEVTDYEADLVLFHQIVHEMFHMKSYNAIQSVDEEEFQLQAYRSGLNIISRDGKEAFFRPFDEAVTEELTKQVLLEGELGDSELLKERQESQEAKAAYHGSGLSGQDNRNLLVSDDTYYFSLIPVDQENTMVRAMNFGYSAERELLAALIKEIFKKKSGVFLSEQEVLDVFIKAKLTGNILPMGKLIDETFGKGSFRKLGEIQIGTENYQETLIWLKEN